MKKSISIIVLLVLVLPLVLSACGSTATPVEPTKAAAEATKAPEAKPVKIAVIGKSVHPYWSNVEKGVMAAGKDLGIETVFFVPPKEDVAAQIQTMETYIAQGVTGIAIAPSDPNALEATMKKASEAGIFVTTLDTPPIEGSASIVYIGTDNFTAGKSAGTAMAALLPDGGKVGIGRGSDTALNALQRTDGFLEGIKANGKITTLEPVNDKEDAATALQLANSVISANPDLAGAFGVYAYNGPAWATAIKEAGMVGRIKLVSFDATTDIINGIKECAIDTTVAQREYDMGYKSVQIIKLMAEKGKDAALTEMGAVKGVIDTGVDLISAATLKDYEATLDKKGIPHEWNTEGWDAATCAEAEVPARADGLPAYTGGPAELRMGWWGNDDRAARTQQVIDLFMAAYPEIKVTGEPNGGTPDHFAIIDTQLAGNNAPDLIQFGGNWPDYQQYLEPLNGYLGKQLLIDTAERFDQIALIPSTAADGNLYAVSLGTNTLVLAYNKTMIEAAGVALPKDNMTWDELFAYGKELKAKLPEGVAPFVDNSTNQANYLSYFYTQQGTQLWTLDEGGKSYATVESAKKWLQMWADMRAEGLIPDADTTATYAETGADVSALVAGKAAIGLIWSNQIAGYQAAMTDKLGATTLPKGGEKSYVIQMSQYLGMYKGSKNKEAAALFINFFVTSPEAGAVLQTNRGVPCSPAVRTAISGQSTETDAAVYRIYSAVADRTIPQGPNLPNDQEFVNELRLIGQAVAYGQSTVDKAAEDLQALIGRLAVK